MPRIYGKEAVWSALGSLASSPPEERTLTGFSLLLQSNPLKAALLPYTLEGPFGALLDAAGDEVVFAGAIYDKPVVSANCTNPVAMQYRLGQRMGLEGTPMVLAGDGTQLGGYLPPAQLRQALDKLAAGS